MASSSRSSAQLSQKYKDMQVQLQQKAKRALEIVSFGMLTAGVPPQIEQMKMDRKEWESFQEMTDGQFGFSDPRLEFRKSFILGQIQKLEPKLEKIEEEIENKFQEDTRVSRSPIRSRRWRSRPTRSS